MAGIFDGPKIEIVASSGMLSVTVRPRPHWAMALATLGADLLFASFLYDRWSVLPMPARVIWIWALVSTVLALVYQFSSEETIEIDAKKLTIRKGLHGWERTREYEIEACSELEWEQGREGSSPGLRCKVGWRPIRFGRPISGDEASEILSALQRVLPEVAQKICAYPGGKEHFITLGLNRG